MTLADFKVSQQEMTEVERIRSNLFTYVIQRKAAQECVNMVIGDFRQFLWSSDSDKVERSNVHYLELIDENPDSDEVMLRVTEDLLDKFSTNSHQSWIVLGKEIPAFNANKVSIWRGPSKAPTLSWRLAYPEEFPGSVDEGIL